MNKKTSKELADFLRFCRSERRLAPMTCSAYVRHVSACLGYLQGEGNRELAEVKGRTCAPFSQMSTTRGPRPRARRARRPR